MHTQDFYFEIKKDEKILRIIHRHWFDIFVQYIPLLGLLLLMLGSFFAAPFMFTNVTAAGSELFFFFQSLILLILWLYGFLIWVDYYLDVWIVTSQRVINIEQRGLFARHVSELKFTQLQDVSTEVEGFIPTLLNYGDIHAQTAAEETRFTFRHVPNPYRIKATLMELQQKAQKEDLDHLASALQRNSMQ